ncbi:hypothetical protein [Curtobacterium sp. Leaf261]|uniref:hypothetical protein n=1 Tax=Curtobacterium sp. Leaf261 TaxID=1736311 RepID=UPI0006FFBA25|nr:hypothetical protein [Curtobacterium sp. Leaf261]KQO62328.1 hypothetical protein ASF23_11065 [Curtobacterium sp. Leaf261]
MSARDRWRTLGGALTGRTLLWVAIVVVVLIVVDVVLVAVAVGRTAPADHGTPGPVPTFTSGPTPSGTASAAATPSPTATSFPGAAGGDTSAVTADERRFLSVVDGTTAWRATAGSCSDAAASVERSTDGGDTWKAVDFGSFDLRSVSALSAGSTKTTVHGGVGASCTPTGIASFTSGRFWAADAGAAPATLTDQGIRFGDGTTADAPCTTPRQVVDGDDGTAVVCADVLAWRDGSGPWVMVPMTGLRAVATSGTEYTVARVGQAGCDGIAIETLDAGSITRSSTPTAVGCAPATTTSGAVAVGQDGKSMWVWSGDQVLVSKDGGATW